MAGVYSSALMYTTKKRIEGLILLGAAPVEKDSFRRTRERERERAVRAKVNKRRESEIDTIWKLEEERVRDHLIFLPFGMRLPNIHT